MVKIRNSKLTIDNLNGIYKNIAEDINIEVALLMHENYKGLNINFPIKLYSKEYIREQIKKEYNGKNLRELARKYEFSERWIRKLISSNNNKENNGGEVNKNDEK